MFQITTHHRLCQLFLSATLALVVPATLQGESEAPLIEAHAGEHYGVARVQFEVGETSGVSQVEARFNLAGNHGRVLYPVFYAGEVPTGINASPESFEVLFLFVGKEPFKLTAMTNLSKSDYREFHATITPTAAGSPASRRALTQHWWSGYRAVLEAARNADRHYPVVENYLSWYLPRSIDLPGGEKVPGIPSARPVTSRPLQFMPEFEKLADLLMGTESIRIAMQRDTLLDVDGANPEPLTERLPQPVRIPPVNLPDIPEDLEVEALAACVPVECLYVRFPRFSTFQKLRGRFEDLGGMLHDLVLGRAFDARVQQTLETQLALRETTLSRLFGDLVIGEVALVARDTFVRVGSALGIIFEVKNRELFMNSIGELRDEMIATSGAWPRGGAVEKEVETGAGTARLLIAPGNRVRSFHVEAGAYHLITNSQWIARRFLECAAGEKGSLAVDPGFRHCRDLHRIGEKEDAFVFISDPFIRELIGPACRAELTRRARARAEMELIEVARLVARAETGKTFKIGDLIREQYLPVGMQAHADGATYSLDSTGVMDSLRGARGTFLPIPDVDVKKLTATELRAYERFRAFYRGQWGRVDPVAIRLCLTTTTDKAGKPSEDQYDLTVDILPFARNPYMFLRMLAGPISERTIDVPPEEVLSAEMELKMFITKTPAWVRVGMLDFEMPLIFEDDALQFNGLHHVIPWYGIIPYNKAPNGGLDTGIIGTAMPVEGTGMYTLAGYGNRKLWARPNGEFMVISPDRESARRLADALEFVDGIGAQARMGIERLAEKKLARALDVQSYLRLREASRSGAAFLSLLHRELKVPLEQCQHEAQRLLAMAVTDPAGGNFQWHAYPASGAPFFRSDAFPKYAQQPIQIIQSATSRRHRFVDLLKEFRVGLSFSGQSLHSEIRLRLKARK